MANFTSAINALVDERDRVFLLRVATDYNLKYEELHQKYLETAEQAIKVPRKYTKKPTGVTVATESVKPVKEPKVKAEKAKCTACTSKKEPCRFSALKGEVFCKRHLRSSLEEGTEPKPKAVKKTAASKAATQPVHTHELAEQPTEPCQLCESHGNPLAEIDTEFEVVNVAERLAAILAGSDSDAESDDAGDDLIEEAFDEE